MELGVMKNGLSISYQPWLNRFAWLNVTATFILVIMGALVTSHRAGLSVPDWPTTYGYFMFSFPLSKTVGAIFYEHTHRLVASGVGILTLFLCIWLFLAETRWAVRWLGLGAIGLVLVQGALGGLTVLHALPAILSAAHATLAQVFLCVVIAIAFCTNRDWFNTAPASIPRARTVQLLCSLVSLFVFFQLILGTLIRHSEQGLMAHFVGGLIVLMAIVAAAVAILLIPEADVFFQHVLALFLLVSGQITLGFATLMVHVPKDAVQNLGLLQIYIPTLHLMLGALILATSMALTLRCYRLFKQPPETEQLPESPETAS